MSKLAWYWHRLRAMSPVEMALHARKKLRQFRDARSHPNWRKWELKSTGAFPSLPDPAQAPEALRAGLKHDVEEILAGRWKAFGHLEIQVDDPPCWHTDYLVWRDFATSAPAFSLNHRELPGGADIKLIWELSRWYPLVRLAMAAYVLDDERAARKCVEWLEDWVKHNSPYRGWNWTSALEAGMRLIQFTWIDALLSASGARTAFFAAGADTRTRLSALRELILAPHAYFVWRHKSFGSSANNHLLGELAGLIVASVRWPELQRWAAPLETLQFSWQREVLAQFAEDGGNKEQALNYHLFSWEFCWQARKALLASGRQLSPSVEQRLSLAAEFFGLVQVETDPWDYGDSDNAFVTPLFASDLSAAGEWWDWLRGFSSESLSYWWGEPPIWSQRAKELVRVKGGSVFPNSQIAVDRWNLWTLRFDSSPLGYLGTAAHGHLDALHLSIWYRGIAIVVDPGTGAYFADADLRRYLASWEAHNGPHPSGLDYPMRCGAFLWSEHHAIPQIRFGTGEVRGQLDFPTGRVSRRLLRQNEDTCWVVEDCYEPSHGAATREFTVRWQFAPGSWVKRIEDRTFSVHRKEVAINIRADENWHSVELVEPAQSDENRLHPIDTKQPLEGIVSTSFRRLCRAPFLKLTARVGDKPCVFRTTFLASPHS